MKLNISVRGPADAQFVWLADETGTWYATCKPEHAEAVQAAIEATIANGGNLPTDNKGKEC